MRKPGTRSLRRSTSRGTEVSLTTDDQNAGAGAPPSLAAQRWLVLRLTAEQGERDLGCENPEEHPGAALPGWRGCKVARGGHGTSLGSKLFDNKRLGMNCPPQGGAERGTLARR